MSKEQFENEGPHYARAPCAGCSACTGCSVAADQHGKAIAFLVDERRAGRLAIALQACPSARAGGCRAQAFRRGSSGKPGRTA